MSERGTPIAEPVQLDYGRPARRPFSVMTFLIGMASSLFIAVGCGMIIFGMMLKADGRTDGPPAIAFGVGFLVMGAGVAITSWAARR